MQFKWPNIDIKRKKDRAVLLIVPIILTVTLFFIYYQPPKKLAGYSDNTPFIGVIYDDKEAHGNSVCHKVKENASLTSFNYTLGDRREYPFAGISYQDTTGLIDLSGYDRLELSISATEGTRLILSVLTIIEGYTVPGNYDT